MCHVLAIACVLLLVGQPGGAQQPQARPALQEQQKPRSKEQPKPKGQDKAAPKPGPTAPRKGPSGISMTVLARVGYFQPSDSAARAIYPNGQTFDAEAQIDSWWLLQRRLVFWAGGSYRKEGGAFSYTKERTTMSVMAVEGGLLFRFVRRRGVAPYAGVGFGHHAFKEANDVVGTASAGAFGYCALAGVSMVPARRVVVDVRAKWNAARMQPADFDIDVGGIAIGVGVGMRF